MWSNLTNIFQMGWNHQPVPGLENGFQRIDPITIDPNFQQDIQEGKREEVYGRWEGSVPGQWLKHETIRAARIL